MTLPEIPNRYILSMDRLNWTELLLDWLPLIPRQSDPWLLTKFGEVFFCHPDGKIGMLQVSSFKYECVAKDKGEFQEWLEDPDKMANWFLAPLVDHLESAGRWLTSDRCYSFIKHLALGGTLAMENVVDIPIQEHFGCWGEVFRQIKGVPDGEQVVLKISRKNRLTAPP